METHSSQKFGMDGQMDITELHRDLERKHGTTGLKVAAIWRKSTPEQRGKAMRESTGDGIV